MLKTPMRDQPAVIIDLRCLQDTAYHERGIGQHVRSALRLAREVSGFARAARLVGLVAPDLPPLAPEMARLCDEVRSNGYVASPAAGTVFLNPSPMGHDPVFLGRLLLDKAVRKTAMVYDFIPFEAPGTYLRADAERLNYLTALAWLNQYDHFLPISEDTAEKIRSLIRHGHRPADVTGVPIAPFFAQAPAGAARLRHILTIAGHDSRKNPELLIRAHARSRLLQERRIPLVIGGNYPAGMEAVFRAMAGREGGEPGLVELPGRVPEAVLLGLYRAAYCVVTPSRAEGFSMPVIEGMAAGAPSLASDILAHAALVSDPQLRFDPDDEERVRGLIERSVQDQAWREAIVAAQAPVWRVFKAEAVAAKIWAAVERLAAGPAAPAVGRGARPRIAFVTPLPPARSGVADYSAACAQAVGKLAEVTLFTPSERPAEVGGVRPLPLSDLAYLEPRFDRVVSVLGNSSHHEKILDRLVRYGGAGICHDSRLLHFYAFRHGDGYAHAAGMAARELGRRVSVAEVKAWIDDEGRREVTLFGEIAAAASPLIFHAAPSAAAVRQRFGTPAVHLPFAIYRPWDAAALTPAARAAARRRLNLDPQEVHVASFGFLIPAKGYVQALLAIKRLSRRLRNVRLHWVGEPGGEAELFRALAGRLGVADRVTLMPDFMPEDTYRDYLIAADCGLQLRDAGSGSVSGALQDCIAAGLPTVANHDLTAMIDAPPGYVTAVGDQLEPAEIAAALAALIETRPATEAARAAYCAAHGMERYAADLLALLDL